MRRQRREHTGVDFIQVTWQALLAANLVIAAGAMLQASTGLGAALLVVPLLVMINPVLVPGPLIFASLLLTLPMTLRGRHEFRPGKLNKVLAGIFTGTLVAVSVTAVIQHQYAEIAFGTVILFAVAMSVYGFRIPVTHWSEFAAGILCGFMGTIAAIGAPALALLYQDEEGKKIRPMLAYLYLFGSLTTLAILFAAGFLHLSALAAGLLLMPGFLIGYLLSPRVAAFLDGGYIRAAILGTSAVSALALVARGAVKSGWL